MNVEETLKIERPKNRKYHKSALIVNKPKGQQSYCPVNIILIAMNVLQE